MSNNTNTNQNQTPTNTNDGADKKEEAKEEIDSTIIESLKEEEEKEKDTNTQTQTAEKTKPAPAVDITQLSAEQLQALKAALNATPDTSVMKKTDNIVKVRRIDGKYVMGIKNARLVYMENESGDRKIETHIIPVLLDGEEEYKDMRYKEFMAAEQVPCKVTKTNKHEVPVVEGETRNEFNQLVEMVRTDVHFDFVVQTPDGKELKLDGSVINA